MIAAIRATSNRLAELSASLQALGEEALDHGVITCIEVAAPRTPVDTGALVGNVVIESVPMGRNVIWTQHYAAYQEFGTSRGVPAAGFARAGAAAGVEAMDAHLRTWGA